MVFTLAWTIAPAAQHGYRPLRDDLSALEALTATRPWIMIGGDLALAAGIAALTQAVGTALRGPDTTVAVAILATAATGVVVQALAREDCNTALGDCTAREHAGLVTWHHHLHGPTSAVAWILVLGVRLAPRPVPSRRPVGGRRKSLSCGDGPG